jgi:predicted class III extradiol MEMO1 family dioxygenase
MVSRLTRLVVSTLCVACVSLVFASSNAPLIFSDSKFEKERRVVHQLLKSDIENAQSLQGVDKVSIEIALADLNEDGMNDILAIIHHSFFCGSAGCSFLMLIATSGEQWKIGLNDMNTHGDVRISDHKTQGFHDLIFGGRAIWKWTGKRYEHAYNLRKGR